MGKKHNINTTVVLTDEATEEEREQARDQYGSDNIEIDDNAKASRSDHGVWVAAWVWLGGDDDDRLS